MRKNRTEADVVVMKKTILLTGLVMLIAIGVGGFAIRQAQSARRSETSVTAADRRLADMRALAAQLERECSSAAASEQALQQVPVTLATPTPGGPIAVPAAPRQGFDLHQLLRERPDLRPLYEAAAAASEMEPYGWLIASLPPEQAERFARERLRHDQRVSEISTISRAAGWERGDPRRTALRQPEDDLHATEMTAVLGEARAREYREHEKTIRPRDFVAGELAGQLFYTEAPLTPTQALELTRLTARHGTDAAGKFDFDAMNWDRLVEDARAILAPLQRERLENLVAQRQVRARAIVIEREFGARFDGK